ncbi:hypothetical protein [Deinococcus aquaticus]|uniref:hypothetical protein n=1 Tax=Deinococcus aquaticus TaxID=328692 RepID=UPI003F487EC3
MANFDLLADAEKLNAAFREQAPTLSFLAGDGLGHAVPITDLRTMHAELQALGVHPVTEQLDWDTAARTLVHLPRESASLLVTFVIHGEQVLPSRYAELPSQVDAHMDRLSLRTLFKDAGPGDRVVVVGVNNPWFGKPASASGVYRVITLT